MIGRCCDCAVRHTPSSKHDCEKFEPKRELDLVLKAKWWDMIASGEKPEEYRDITQHYRSRICAHAKTCEMASVCKANINCHYDSGVPLKHDVVVLRRGYTSTVMRFRIEKVVIGFGRPEWGAQPGVKYYVIKLGERL